MGSLGNGACGRAFFLLDEREHSARYIESVDHSFDTLIRSISLTMLCLIALSHTRDNMSRLRNLKHGICVLEGDDDVRSSRRRRKVLRPMDQKH